jgi:hypothetical protein
VPAGALRSPLPAAQQNTPVNGLSVHGVLQLVGSAPIAEAGQASLIHWLLPIVGGFRSTGIL